MANLIKRLVEDTLYTHPRQEADDARRCQWKLDSSHNAEVWETQCGRLWSFTEGGPDDNRFGFCHGCGNPIAIDAAISKESDNEQ